MTTVGLQLCEQFRVPAEWKSRFLKELLGRTKRIYDELCKVIPEDELTSDLWEYAFEDAPKAARQARQRLAVDIKDLKQVIDDIDALKNRLQAIVMKSRRLARFRSFSLTFGIWAKIKRFYAVTGNEAMK